MKKIVFIILFVLTFLFSLFVNKDKINVPYFGALNKKIYADLIYENNVQNPEKTILFDDKKADNILKIDKNHYLLSIKKNKLIKKIKINDTKNIKKIVVYEDSKIIYQNKDVKLKPFSKLKINTSKPLYDKLAISFLSFFYNPIFYFVSYVFLFFIISCTKKPLNSKSYFCLMIFLTVFLRLAQLNNIPFWDDEIYTIKITELNMPFGLVFSDPGNPPLYFILFKIFRFFVQNPDFWRISSVILGCCFNIVFYFYLKKILNKKAAKIGLFITAISVVLIYFSQEIRCYMLLMLLSVMSSLFLFNFKKKNRFYYFIVSSALLYTHFYGAFLVLYNFIFGFFFYFNKKRKFDFLRLNLFSFLVFLPILFYKKTSLSNDFNSWITKPNWLDIKLVLETFCGHGVLFLIFLIVCIYAFKKVRKRKEKVFVYYNFCSIVFIFISAIIFSYLIKPIFSYRYFYVVYPCYLALISYFLCIDYKFKFQIVLKTIILIFFALYSRLNYQNLFCNHNLYLEFIKNDIDYSINNYIFMSDTIEGYRGFEDNFKDKNNVKIIYLPVNKGIKEIGFDSFNFKKPYSAYVINLYLKDDVYKNASIIELYKTPLGVYTKSVYK